ncbi:hypothetical protein [Vibrio phage Va2]|nr:hypothetical protein [Vibrio phage Va2]
MMKALDLLSRVQGIEDIEESITLTWDSDSNTGHNQTWIKNVGKKYSKLLGKFMREVEVKTSKGPFWILVYQKGAFAGQTVRPGVGKITHAGLVELGKKKGRWTLTSDNVLNSSSGAELRPIPDNIRSARQLISTLESTAETSEVVVSEKDAKEVEAQNSDIIKSMLEEYFRTTLPPMSSINYNEKNQMFLLKSPKGTQLFGCVWKQVGAGLYNVAVQGIDGRSQNLSKIDSPYDVITSRLRTMLQDPDTRQIIALDTVAAMAEKVTKDVEIKVRNNEVQLITYIDDKHLNYLGRFTFRKGLLRFIPGSGDVLEERVSLNDITVKLVEDLIEEGKPVFDDDFVKATKNWTKNDEDITFKKIENGHMKVYHQGIPIGYCNYDGHYVNFYDGEYLVSSSVRLDQHSITGDIQELDNGSIDESKSVKVQRFLSIIS